MNEQTGQNPADTINHIALYAALVAAQSEIEAATKESANPHFKSKYASLAAVIEVVRPALNKYGLALLQIPGCDADGLVTVQSTVIHKQGGTLSFPTPLGIKTDGKAQTVGSAITYLRRYSLAAIFCVAQEDDDGNAAQAAEPVQRFAARVERK